MLIKNILFLYFVCHATYIHSSSFGIALILNKKFTQQRPSVFIQAEKREQEFITTRAQCLQAHDCDTHQAFTQARYLVMDSVHELKDYIEILKQNKADSECYKNEKTEAKEIKKRLLALIKSIQ